MTHSPKPQISVLITDLDNTIYDWVGVWFGWFGEIFGYLTDRLGIPPNELAVGFKEIHLLKGTVELAYSFSDIPILCEKLEDSELKQVNQKVQDLYRDANLSTEFLYADVKESLRNIKEAGALIVGYTESPISFAEFRIHSLGLDGLYNYIYAPESDKDRLGILEEVKSWRHSSRIRKTVFNTSLHFEGKPDPSSLLAILKETNTRREKAVYLGDSLVRDVSMAKAANIADVWAKYGDSRNRPEYELLREVTHWDKDKVDQEMNTTVDEVMPSWILESNFSEIFDVFQFEPSI